MKERHKKKRRLPGAGGASILPRYKTQKQNLRSPFFLPCALLSVRIATLKLPPPLRTFQIFSTIGEKKNSQRIQRSKCGFRDTSTWICWRFLALERWEIFQATRGGVRKRNLEVFYLLLGSGGGGEIWKLILLDFRYLGAHPQNSNSRLICLGLFNAYIRNWGGSY